MKTVAITLLLCACVSLPVCADGPLQAGLDIDLPAKTLALVVAEGEKPPEETGPGFRSFARVMMGDFDTEDGGTYRNALPPVVQNFGDLQYFSVRFSTLKVTDERPIQSFDLMGQHLMRQGRPLLDEPSALRAGYWMPGGSIKVGKLPVAERAPHVTDLQEEPQSWVAETRSVAYFAYGVHLDQGDDRFGFDGDSSVAGRVYSITEARHTLIGPQLGIGRVFSNDRLQLDLGGYVMLGYGDARLRQTNGFGDDPVPGGANNLFLLQPTKTIYQNSKGYFASRAEARLRASYLIKANWSIDAVARGYAHGTWYKAAEHVEYSLGKMRLLSFNRGSLVDGDLYLGLTYLH